MLIEHRIVMAVLLNFAILAVVAVAGLYYMRVIRGGDPEETARHYPADTLALAGRLTNRIS